MAGINRVTIVGRLGNDPEIRTMPNGDAVANFSVATSENWTDKNTGERREQTEWHRIIFYRRQAEIVGQYLQKGSQVYIEGKLKTRKWQDKNGTDHYTTEIQADVCKCSIRKNKKPPHHHRHQLEVEMLMHNRNKAIPNKLLLPHHRGRILMMIFRFRGK